MMAEAENVLVVSIDEEAGLAVARLSGAIHAHDLQRARTSIARQRAWSSQYCPIFDLPR